MLYDLDTLSYNAIPLQERSKPLKEVCLNELEMRIVQLYDLALVVVIYIQEPISF